MPVVSLSPLHCAEGLTLDSLLRIADASLLNPVLSWTLPVLAVLRAASTSSLDALLPALQRANYSHLVRTDRPFQLALGLFAVGVALRVNDALSRAVRNNLTRDRKGWDWKDEVVAITGGAPYTCSLVLGAGLPSIQADDYEGRHATRRRRRSRQRSRTPPRGQGHQGRSPRRRSPHL